MPAGRARMPSPQPARAPGALTFNWSGEHLCLDPVESDHVAQEVISQPRPVFFLEKGLEVPNKQYESCSGGSSAALSVTPAT